MDEIHRTMSISAIPNIKSYSCFRPYNFNRLALKRLPCYCAGCLVMNKVRAQGDGRVV